MKCNNCRKDGATYEAKPSRHFMSPNPASFSFFYCDKECANKVNKQDYANLALLDRNASDSECFIHDHWEGIMRVGKCKITGKEVRVEPLQPGDNSGQPKECYEHFELNERYRKYL